MFFYANALALSLCSHQRAAQIAASRLPINDGVYMYLYAVYTLTNRFANIDTSTLLYSHFHPHDYRRQKVWVPSACNTSRGHQRLTLTTLHDGYHHYDDIVLFV